MNFSDAFTFDNLRFILEGFYMTLKVAFASIVLSFVLGSLVGIIRYMKVPILSPILTIFVEITRNLPLLLILYFSRFALPEYGIHLGPVYASILALTLFEGAMISEIVRSGLKSIDKGQIEAARSSGLSYISCLWHIVLPQGMRRMVPPLVSQFISLLKDTSLAVVITLPELMNQSKIVIGQNITFAIPVLLLAAVLYFTVNYALSLVSKRLETKIV